jgi:hypothetical protein
MPRVRKTATSSAQTAKLDNNKKNLPWRPQLHSTQEGIVDFSPLHDALAAQGAVGFEHYRVCQTTDAGRRCIALVDIKQDTEVLRIPLRCCLGKFSCPDSIMNHPSLSANETNDEDDIKMYKRILTLLYAKSDSATSVMKAYVNLLPSYQNFRESFPLFWTPAQLDRCGPASVVPAMVKRMQKQTQSAYEALLPLVEASELSLLSAAVFTEDFVKWATCVLDSRSFSRPIKGETLDILVPAGDIFNHCLGTRPQCNLQVRFVDGEGTGDDVVFFAKRNILAGEELLFEYRKTDCNQMLVYYGFAPETEEQDSHDAAFFPVSFPGQTLTQPQAVALQSLQLPVSIELAVPATFADPLPSTLVWALRVRAMDESQLAAFCAGQVAFRRDQETQVWATIRKLITETVAWYEAALICESEGSTRSEVGSGKAKDDSSVPSKFPSDRHFHSVFSALYRNTLRIIRRSKSRLPPA